MRLLLIAIVVALLAAPAARATTATTATKIVAHVFAAEASTATCIADAESSLRPDAVHRNVDGSIDRGLFQINSFWIGHVVKYRARARHVWIRVRANRLLNPLYNARVAWAISHGGSSWGAWRSVTVNGACR